MARKPVQIGSMHFARKSDATRFFRDMLNRYAPGDDVSPADTILLRALLERHPEATQKMGVGITGFKVRSADYNTQCFWVSRSNGSTEKFSFYACI